MAQGVMTSYRLNKAMSVGAENCYCPKPYRIRVTVRGQKRTTVALARVVLEATQGPLLPGEYALHKCDNEACINPAHLEKGSQQKNIQDYFARRHLKKTSAA